MSAFTTTVTTQISPFGDAEVEVTFDLDLVTEEITITETSVEGAHFEHKMVYFKTTDFYGKEKFVSFEDHVYQTLIEKAEAQIGTFSSAIADMKGEAKFESRRDD